jgi:hypothetical protein
MSPPVQTVADLEGLREKAEQIEDLVTPQASIEERVKDKRRRPSRTDRRRAWHRQVEDAVLDLSSSMPEGIEDYDVRKLFELVVELRHLLDTDPDVLDTDGSVELATMRVADIARRLHRRLAHEQLDDPQVAVKVVLDGLARVPVSDVARLLGVSTKTVRAWQRGSPVRQNATRVVLIAQLLSYLRSSMSAVGVVMWFDAERDQLGGQTPLRLLEQDIASAYPLLTDLARGARAQLAG